MCTIEQLCDTINLEQAMVALWEGLRPQMIQLPTFFHFLIPLCRDLWVTFLWEELKSCLHCVNF
jgi:hypothetical protein